MLRKLICFAVVILLSNFIGGGSVYSQSKKSENESRRITKVKAGVNKIGTGADTKISIKLRDGSKLKGSISEINDDSFTVVEKSGNATIVEFSNVKRINGKGLSKGAWVAIGAGIGAAAFVLGFWIWLEHN